LLHIKNKLLDNDDDDHCAGNLAVTQLTKITLCMGDQTLLAEFLVFTLS
jgi:hypothetical protein